MKINCIIFRRRRHLSVSVLALAFLILPTLIPFHFMAQGRQLSMLSDNTVRRYEVKMVKMRSMIGSRPPRCEERCKSCGHCEAVQVPIVPIKTFQEANFNAKIPKTVAYSRGDDITNYKPMCWKCKCGDFIFSP
ncbi:epidermal patterning factor-like protein 2 [Phtheirospermum japonicum]|uniref:Epidermal patterning factor-like protein n=1 Tax=Phtheirospermum japonicum TaxID=374723 RepID=A0A830BVJ6_9LAMI|nr:epidermal patterning factor-like protein 2 [Phtheirospermum japonicum]